MLLLVTRTSLCSAETAPPDALTSDTILASESYFVLTWSTTSVTNNLGLQQISSSPGSEPVLRAQGLPDTGSLTITGLMDGDYTYRLLVNNLPLGNPVDITVRHHALNRALGYFGLGLALFIILIASIILGNMRAEKSYAD